MTAEQFATQYNRPLDSVRMKLRRINPGVRFDRFAELSDRTIEQLLNDKRKKSGEQYAEQPAEKMKRAKRARTIRREQPEADQPAEQYGLQTITIEQPEAAEQSGFDIGTIRGHFLSFVLLSVVLGHAALIWYDCSDLWGEPGTIGGGVAFLIILAAVLLATDETRIRTSGTALWFVFLIDICAWWVHFPTFQRIGVSDVVTGCFCAFLCACSWAALFLYRDKNID